MLPDEPIIHTLIVLNKLVKDGYITDEEQQTTSRHPVSHEITGQTKQSAYFISYEGILFKEFGGYAAKYKRDAIEIESIKNDLALRKKNDRRLVNGTWFVGFAALALVAWEIYKTFYLDRG